MVPRGTRSVEKKLYGSILDEPRGESVAGWDKVFCPEGYDKSIAERGIEVKNTISHRSRAMEKMAGSLKEIRRKNETGNNRKRINI